MEGLERVKEDGGSEEGRREWRREIRSEFVGGGEEEVKRREG